ncbi:MAG: helix-turn-helix domain-containing protein [Bacteroidota bacterium]
MHQNDIVDVIIDRRKSLKVTQEVLSELSGISLRTIKQLESGKGNPTLNTILRLTDVLGLDIKLAVKKMRHGL